MNGQSIFAADDELKAGEERHGDETGVDKVGGRQGQRQADENDKGAKPMPFHYRVVKLKHSLQWDNEGVFLEISFLIWSV